MMDHIRELQGRLFAVVLTFVLIAAAAYPFFDKIAAILMAPLKPDQQLVYLTPGGAFSFIIKVCIYIGIIGSLPMIIYHTYRFLMPALKHVHLKTVLRYTMWSLVLAIAGIVFAYYVSLPAALYFLTSFDLNHISPMLTIDSYFSFVMTYLLAGALLFQLPILMIIINTITPLTPKKLMSYQRHLIVGSFIVAAVISPTPDALNQTLLAAPMIVMYQLGIILIWVRNRKVIRTTNTTRLYRSHTQPMQPIEPVAPLPLSPLSQEVFAVKTLPSMRPPQRVVRRIDGFMPQRPLPSRPAIVPSPSSVARLHQSVRARPRTIDGFFVPARS